MGTSSKTLISKGDEVAPVSLEAMQVPKCFFFVFVLFCRGTRGARTRGTRIVSPPYSTPSLYADSPRAA